MWDKEVGGSGSRGRFECGRDEPCLFKVDGLMEWCEARPGGGGQIAEPGVSVHLRAALELARVGKALLQRGDRCIEISHCLLGLRTGIGLVVGDHDRDRARLVLCQRFERCGKVPIHPCQMVDHHRKRVVGGAVLKPGEASDLNASDGFRPGRLYQRYKLVLLLTKDRDGLGRRVAAAPATDQDASDPSLDTGDSGL